MRTGWMSSGLAGTVSSSGMCWQDFRTRPHTESRCKLLAVHGFRNTAQGRPQGPGGAGQAGGEPVRPARRRLQQRRCCHHCRGGDGRGGPTRGTPTWPSTPAASACSIRSPCCGPPAAVPSSTTPPRSASPGRAGMASYSAAKHGVLGLTRSAALDVAGSGVTDQRSGHGWRRHASAARTKPRSLPVPRSPSTAG